MTVCRCSHDLDHHRHHSSSTHCAMRFCPCQRFRGPSLLERWRAWRRSRQVTS